MIRMPRLWAAAVCAVMIALRPAAPPSAQTAKYQMFASPEDAVKALIASVKKGSIDELLAMFGPEGQDLIASSDPATGRRNREVFKVAAAEGWRLLDEPDGHKTLVIGHEDWPFPVPLLKESNGWRFDTAAGKEEILNRRIGRNELAAMAICRTYVAAQQKYAAVGHDGKPAGLYATAFHSVAGKENGLYWPTARGQKRSPLGDLVAEAAAEGVPLSKQQQPPVPFYGYYFRILTAQGPAAPGGAKSYIVKGGMSAGFALVAWPAEYDVTGIMTFIVNQDGQVREKDLGPETDAAARKMKQYNPDASWHPSVQP